MIATIQIVIACILILYVIYSEVRTRKHVDVTMYLMVIIITLFAIYNKIPEK